jgi:hypothetical protein
MLPAAHATSLLAILEAEGPEGPPGRSAARRQRENDETGGRSRNADADPADEAMSLRIVGDFIEFHGARVARLLPNLRLSLLDRLTETFDSMEEDQVYIKELEERLAAQEEAREAAPSGARR